MRTHKATSLGVALVAAMFVLANAAQAKDHPVIRDYFPLQVGNEWLYTADSFEVGAMVHPQPQLVRVVCGHEQDGMRVCSIDNYGFGAMDGTLSFYSCGCNLFELGDTGQVGCWYNFASQPDFPVSLPLLGSDCIHGLQGRAVEGGPVTVPAGTFNRTITIVYTTRPCEDAGWVSETFAAPVGLIQRQELTFAGTIVWQLQWATINGFTFGNKLAPLDGAAGSPIQLEESTWGAIKSTFVQ